MEYDVIVECDPETRRFTATVAGIPSIIVDAKREASAVKMAREAIAFYLREARRRSPTEEPHAHPFRAKVVPVEV